MSRSQTGKTRAYMSYACMNQPTRKKVAKRIIRQQSGVPLIGTGSRVPHPSEKGVQGAGTLRRLATAMVVIISPFLWSLYRTIKLYLNGVHVRKPPCFYRTTASQFAAPQVDERLMVGECFALPTVLASPTLTVSPLRFPDDASRGGFGWQAE